MKTKKSKKGIGIWPLFDIVFLEAVAKKNTTESGIILQDADKNEPFVGKIVAVGPGKRDDNGVFHKMSLKVGDVVCFKKYSALKTTVDWKEYLICSEDDIIAIKNKNAKK